MEVLDRAYELKKALSESQEVKDFKESYDKVKSNASSKRMLDDYKKKEMELQAMQYSGHEPDMEELAQLEKLSKLISLNPDISRYLQCEYRLGMMMNDISKIITEAIDIDYTDEI